MKILLTGAHGQLGRCFSDAVASYLLSSDADIAIELLACPSNVLDISDEAAVVKTVGDFQPDFIVNAAAYTAVDRAEGESEKANQVNHLGAMNLANAASANDAWLLHVSTDYVFDGSAVEPYAVDHTLNPIGEYGRSKLAGELAVAKNCSKYLIFRTAWVFSEYGNNFVKTMLRLAGERDEVSVVADQYGCPTYAGDIAKVLLAVCLSKDVSEADVGTYHVSGKSPTSWHGFARAVFTLAAGSGVIVAAPELHAIPSSAYPTPVARPEYSVLDCKKTIADIEMSSDWLYALKKVLMKLV